MPPTTHTLTQVSDSVGICVTGELDGPLEVTVGDLAVGQPEALSLARLTGELPQDLHGAGVHHLGEESGSSGHWTESRGKKTKRESDERRADRSCKDMMRINIMQILPITMNSR